MAAHRELDEHPVVQAMVNGNVTRSQFEILLKEYAGWFSAWEPSVATLHPEVVAELGEFRFEKSLWLAEDLERLGVDVPAAAQEIRAAEDGARLAGELYVIEGSTLGGAAMMRSGKGFPSGANRFYEGYGARTGEAWMAMVAWLDGHVSGGAEVDRACAAAVETFAVFRGFLDRAAGA
ncbi:prepilin-type processing-associated H-X9-DG protein [Haloferula luteola]|uniref:Prepilin-type processing-associated H-X9-DG protein n=2 Tax=Haloferula luteola TaxID=595692 RepID=A0A840V931_9BACT|nr:prepilin-type processing-associated H-X9-DG protein [Haloferula luteola]